MYLLLTALLVLIDLAFVSCSLSYAFLKECGYEPNGAIEIGYETGFWMRKIMNIFPSAFNFLLIEQTNYNDYRLQYLQMPFTKVPPLGHNNHNMETIISQSGEMIQTGPMTTQLSQQTVDQILEEYGLLEDDTVGFQLLKLDARGREFDVLLGANKTLQSVELIHLTVPILTPLDTNPEEAPNYSLFQIQVLLERMGFMLYQILYLNARPSPDDVTAPAIHDSFEGIWARTDSFVWKTECTRYPPFQPYSKSFQDFLQSFPVDSLR